MAPGRKPTVFKGDVYDTRNCGKCEVTAYIDADNVWVRFEDGSKGKCSAGDLRSGQVKNFNKPCVSGVGYFGYGFYSQLNHKKLYFLWANMLQRCYSSEYKLKHPTYLECVTSKRWHSFQNFACDVEKMKGYDKLSLGWTLDKDILYKYNCVYSKKCCVLIPQELNKLLLRNDAKRGKYVIGVCANKGNTNPYRAECKVNGKVVHLGVFQTEIAAFEAYKEFKESIIKQMANAYKDQVDYRVYEALMMYEVNIDD